MTMPNKTDASSSLYQKPTSGVLCCLPSSWVPYGELMRINKPFGFFIIFCPSFFGSLFAACISQTSDLRSILSVNLVLLPAAVLSRSAGCTWNDIADRDLDRLVTRCRLRPMARGALSPTQGYVFCLAQIALCVLILQKAGQQTISYMVPILLLAGLYPFAKRITNYPQVVLGLALSWSTIVGCVISGVQPTILVQDDWRAAAALFCLCLAYFIWTLIHDTVYALQDIRDDERAGIWSMSRLYEHRMKSLLSLLGAVQTLALICTGVFANMSWIYFGIACAGTALLMSVMVSKIDPRNEKDCLWWFQYGSLIVGVAISSGLVGEYAVRATRMPNNV